MCVLWQAERTSLHPTRSHFLSQLTMLNITICYAQHFGRCNKKEKNYHHHASKDLALRSFFGLNKQLFYGVKGHSSASHWF